MKDWQPINTAPRDGTRIALRREDCPGYDTDGAWNGKDWDLGSFFVRGDMTMHEVPTHWRPIPDAQNKDAEA